MSKIKIYSTPTCPYCTMVKDFLMSKKINFEDIDVSKDSNKAHEMFEKSNQMGVPQIEIGNMTIIGFDKDKLEKELKKTNIL